MKTVNVTEASVILGYDRQTIKRWIDEGCPHEGAGTGGTGKGYRLELREVVRWLEKRAAKSASGNTDKSDIDEGRRRKIVAEAGLAELQLQEERGELVRIEDIAAKVERALDEVRVKVLAVRTKAPLVAAAGNASQQESLLGKLLEEALDGLRFWAEDSAGEQAGSPDNEGDSGTDETATAPDGKPVG